MCILYFESWAVLFLSVSITSESPMNLRVCVCSIGCGCGQCLRCCCISSLCTQRLFTVHVLVYIHLSVVFVYIKTIKMQFEFFLSMYSDSRSYFSSDPPTGLGYTMLGDGPPLHLSFKKTTFPSQPLWDDVVTLSDTSTYTDKGVVFFHFGLGNLEVAFGRLCVQRSVHPRFEFDVGLSHLTLRTTTTE